MEIKTEQELDAAIRIQRMEKRDRLLGRAHGYSFLNVGGLHFSALG